METLIRDARSGWKHLFRTPGSTLIAVAALALGIGANTAIFSVVNGIILSPLPYQHPNRLLRLFETVNSVSMASSHMEVAPANFLDWQAQATSFAGMAAYYSDKLPLSGDGKAVVVPSSGVSHNLFAVLEVSPVLGRTFTEEEDSHSASELVAVLSYDFWHSRFGGEESVLGKRISLDGNSYTVVGVMPRGFSFPAGTQLWTPLALNERQVKMREARFLNVIGRLKPDVSVSAARAEVEAIAQRLASSYPVTNQSWGVNIVPLLDEEVGKVRPALVLLFGTVALVLLIVDGAVTVVVINETMAHRFWPQGNAIGTRIFIRNEQTPREIVGIVNDVKHFGLDRETAPAMYVPYNQAVIDVIPLVIRTKGDPARLAGAVREQVGAVDPDVAVSRIETMRDIESASMADRRFTMVLLAVFGGLALLLAAMGIYGVVGYSVVQRTREIGIRFALGAQSRDVLRLVVGRGMKLAFAGVAIGLAGAFVLTKSMSAWLGGLLFGVSPTDPLTLGSIAALLIVITLIACWLPARLASKVDPIVAMRHD